MNHKLSIVNYPLSIVRSTIVLLLSILPCTVPSASAEEVSVSSPDGKLTVVLTDADATPTYSVTYEGQTVITPSPLGIHTDLHQLYTDMSLTETKTATITDDYTLDRCKTSSVHYEANQLLATFTNTNAPAPATGNRRPNGPRSNSGAFTIEFQVSNNNIAFRYIIPEERDRRCAVVKSEATSFTFPESTTTFLTPQSHAMIGWKRSKPSYEEEYKADAPLGAASGYGHGYTFPCLFKVNKTTSQQVNKTTAQQVNKTTAKKGKKAVPAEENVWVLISETGVDSHFCGSRLDEPTPEGRYTVAYPMMEENNGFGSTGAQVTLPCHTPWRTITVGGLDAITETTIAFDVVRPLYEPSIPYRFGRSTWSWMVWDDASINEKDLKAFIDLSSEMGWEYTLIDAWWDNNLGQEKMEQLIRYARSKGVEVFLWYNSSGSWNDTSQSPVDCMSDPISRKRAMKWMQSQGVKGIKVDFWGGDKQETMRLYEQVLSDANEYGIMCIFHGCTLPRGWERMYPNYVGSEAVLASENLKFSQHADDMEAFNACLHPYIRNTVGCMEFGGSALNKHYNRDNEHGTTRRTGDGFQLATAVLFQNPIQNFALTPNNLTDAPADAIRFMKEVPTTWDETRFLGGYPGKNVVLARRHGNTWYVAAINAEATPFTFDFDFSLLNIKGNTAECFSDDKTLAFSASQLKASKKGIIRLTIPQNGGTVLKIED